MSANYTIIQYVPRPLADERINLGLIVWDQNGSALRFSDNWARVRAVGGDEVATIKQVVKEIKDWVPKELLNINGTAGAGAGGLDQLIQEWGGKVQFTPARGSLRNASELVADLADVFLMEKPVKRRGRTRRSAVSLAIKTARAAVEQVAPTKVGKLVKPKYVTSGRLDSHQVDVAIANGKLLGALNAFSFEGESSSLVAKDIDATAFAFDDVKKALPEASLGVFMLPPVRGVGRKDYSRAVHIFEGIGVSVFDTQNEMKAWVGEQVRSYA